MYKRIYTSSGVPADVLLVVTQQQQTTSEWFFDNLMTGSEQWSSEQHQFLIVF